RFRKGEKYRSHCSLCCCFLIISKFENEAVINALEVSDNANLTPYETFLFALTQLLPENWKQLRNDLTISKTKSKFNEVDSIQLRIRVGLDALSKFAKIVYKDPVDILVVVSLSGSIDKSIVISEDNKLLVQRNLVPDISGDIKFEATGSGCGLIQAILRYNTISAPEKQMFYLESVCQCTIENCKKRKIIVKRRVTYPKSDKLRTDPNNKILRIDVENNEIVVYFGDINNDGRSFSFDVDEIVEVGNAQPAEVTVFDYYAPENSATGSYSCGNPNSAESPTESEAEP
ncbi:alpha-2-macroglobulin, partial [Caerostris extrusa]